MKKILPLFITLSLTISMFSFQVKAQDSDWELYKEINGVQIYQKVTECHDAANGLHQELILLKFVNTTDQDMELSWTLEAWYDGECSTCDDPDNAEYQFELTLSSGETATGTCDISEGKTLRIFKGFLDKEGTATLTKFELNNMEVNPG